MGMIAVSDDLLKELKRLAVENHSTPDLQAEQILREAIRRWRRENRAETARRIAAMTPAGVVQTDSTLLIREDRDR